MISHASCPLSRAAGLVPYLGKFDELYRVDYDPHQEIVI